MKAPTRHDDGFLDEDGTYHETLADFIGGEMGLCGCGHAENIVFLAWRALDLLNTKALVAQAGGDTGPLWTSLIDLLPDTPQGELIFHVMDNAGFLEHGTSIRGSWLTEDGSQALMLLNEHAASSPDWQAEITRDARNRGGDE